MLSSQHDGEPSHPSQQFASPFAGLEAQAYAAPQRKGKTIGVFVGGALAAAVLAVGGIAIARYLNDPMRTLEQFPVAKYLESHRGLNGSRFKGELHVEAELGWKESVGRLMLFTAENDPRPVAVLVPPDIAKDIYFTKGQTYLAELEVKEGGLIHASRVRKL